MCVCVVCALRGYAAEVVPHYYADDTLSIIMADEKRNSPQLGLIGTLGLDVVHHKAFFPLLSPHPSTSIRPNVRR